MDASFFCPSCHGSIYQRLWCALAAVLHPSGIIAVSLVGLGVAVQILRKWNRPNAFDLVALAFAVAAWLYYAYVIIWHWTDIREWFTATSSEPMTQNAVSILTSTWSVVFVGSSLLVLLWSAVSCRKMVLPALLALGISLVPAVRTQMWYESYKIWTLILLALNGGALISHTLSRFLTTRRPGMRAVAHHAFLAVVCLPLLSVALRNGWLEGPKNYPNDMQWGWGMIMGGDVPYYLENDRVVLEKELAARLGDKAYRLTMLSEADSILMWRGLGRHMFYQAVRTDVEPEIVIIHDSRYKPDWVRALHHSRTAATHQNAGVLHKRDETESWTLWIKPGVVSLTTP
jgi:hypothetical protein